jgi:hypothetical protein
LGHRRISDGLGRSNLGHLLAEALFSSVPVRKMIEARILSWPLPFQRDGIGEVCSQILETGTFGQAKAGAKTVDGSRGADFPAKKQR